MGHSAGLSCSAARRMRTASIWAFIAGSSAPALASSASDLSSSSCMRWMRCRMSCSCREDSASWRWALTRAVRAGLYISWSQQAALSPRPAAYCWSPTHQHGQHQGGDGGKAE